MTNEKQLAQRSKRSNLASTKPGEINLMMPDPDNDRLTKMTVDDSIPAHKQKSFFTAFMSLIQQTRKDVMTTTEHQMILYAMRRHDCRPSQCVAAFWDAFDDPYVPATGVEWRHIRKKMKVNDDGNTYEHRLSDDELEALQRLQQKYESND